MSIEQFLKKENISMLWDVISDEQIFNFLPRDSQSQILQLFSSNIKGFFELEKTKNSNLIDINKKYILLILNYIKKNCTQNVHTKIKILNDSPVKELITYEEIQNDRQSEFEKNLIKRKEEFTESMSLNVPDVPDFSDKTKDHPIGEMDKIIKEMTEKRNYEVEQINYSYKSDINNVNNWLKPQETSIKTEKLIQEENFKNNSRVKNLEKQENNLLKKNVTWGINKEFKLASSNLENAEENVDLIEANIFSKLKKVSKKEEIIDNIKLTIEENTNENKIIYLENEIKSINKKIDIIIELLQNK